MNPPNILTIAGSDSGGGAGIQADLKTIAALGGYGTCVLTALTAQNGLSVSAIHAPDADFVVAQLDAVLQGFTLSAAKTGMLFSSSIISGLAQILKNKTFPLVVDPVSVSQSGHRLLQDEAVTALVENILPLADVLTPNRPEAELLAGMPIATPDDVPVALEKIFALGPKAILLKGGHFPEGQGKHVPSTHVADWLALPGQKPEILAQQKVNTNNTHGTGCTLSAAIATGLGQGLELEKAVLQAQEYLNLCLSNAYAPGQGFGPANHMAPFLAHF